jgi:mono/diheme cytochrome c family protein
MSDKPVKTSLFIYVSVIVAAALIIFFVFSQNFQSGEQTGKSTPPPVGGKQTAVPTVDLRALAKDAGLAAKGKTLFMTNCATCHGPEGYGNGDRAASLNPKPRNYHTEKFKFGDDIADIFGTLTKGSPGTSMPSFALLPQEDLMAMAHYVRTQIPNPTPTNDAVLAKFPESRGSGGSAAPTTAAATPAAKDTSSPRIPIMLAMERMSERPVARVSAIKLERNSAGERIYLQRCASCHGNNGEGKEVRVISVAPVRYESTASLVNPGASWLNNKDKFTTIVTEGIPGRIMPGNGTLTRAEVDALYSYIRAMNAR